MRDFYVAWFILGVHVLLALMIIGLVLLQRGKGAEAGAGFGSGASGTVFGARGTSTLFSKLTAVFAAMFFATSLTLAYLGARPTAEPSSVLERAAQAATATQPRAAAAGRTCARGTGSRTPEVMGYRVRVVVMFSYRQTTWRNW